MAFLDGRVVLDAYERTKKRFNGVVLSRFMGIFMFAIAASLFLLFFLDEFYPDKDLSIIGKILLAITVAVGIVYPLTSERFRNR